MKNYGKSNRLEQYNLKIKNHSVIKLEMNKAPW